MNQPAPPVKGFVHSVETLGTVDGPGLRYVIFFQGCPLRCKYCHNPDTWLLKGGKQVLAEELVADVLRYKNFIKSGGLTLTGGEPLMQPAFAEAVLKGCKENGIHTAVDTAGAIGVEYCKGALDYTDLIILDIKAVDTVACKSLTGQGNENAFRLLDYANANKKSVWIRYVVVPGLTDSLADATRLAERLASYACIEKVELNPFHKMGEYKWKEMGFPYELTDTPPAPPELINEMKEIFKQHGLKL